MGCNCKWCEIIVAAVIFIVVVWPGILGAGASMWVAAIAAVLLLLHALKCKYCGACASEGKMASKGKAKKKKKKK